MQCNAMGRAEPSMSRAEQSSQWVERGAAAAADEIQVPIKRCGQGLYYKPAARYRTNIACCLLFYNGSFRQFAH